MTSESHLQAAFRRAFRPRGLHLLAAVGVTVAILAAAAPSVAASPIQINGQESGHAFDGVGAMSVAAESRLLFDYPPHQQSQILDRLFCTPQVQAAPGYCTQGIYGSALQRLKVEIGADSNSTSGTEPSVERTKGVVDCNVGWEFKLMTAARKRNPHVQIDALAWSWPAWIDPSGQSVEDRVFSQDTISYLLSYLGCAAKNGTPVNTLGVWNERFPDDTQSEAWVVSLRQALDSSGYSNVQLVLDDGAGWIPLGRCYQPQTAATTAYCNAISIIGNHYPGLTVQQFGGAELNTYPTDSAWYHQNNQYSQGSYQNTWSVSEEGGNYASFTFTGTSIKWIGATQADQGMADVYLDGKLVAHDVDTYAPDNGPPPYGVHYQQVLFSKDGLANGQHTIKIVATGDANPASAAAYISVDAFAVDGPPDGTTTAGPCSVQKCVDDASPLIQYGNDVDGLLAEGKSLMATEDAPGLYDTTDGINWYANPQLRGDWPGARYLAQEINTNYVRGDITGEDIFTMLSSYYDQATYADAGLLIANTPWTAAGSAPSYDVQSRTWVVAHTTQFTQPGTWRYVGDPQSPDDTASCYLGTSSCSDPNGETGSYVTLRSSQGADYAIVAETKDATSAQPEQFCLSGGLSTGTVHVWETNATTAFANVANLAPTDGCFSYTLAPDALYTFTDESRGHAGATTQGYSEHGLTLPYSDTFQGYGPTRGQARYFIDQQGAFETGHGCPAGGRQWCLQQVITTEPIEWLARSQPYTIVGNLDWTDYDVQAHLTIPTVGQSAAVIGRLQRDRDDLDQAAEEARYEAQVTNDGNGNWSWTLYRVDWGPSYVALKSGSFSNQSGWITVTLRMVGSQLTVLLDGKAVGRATDTTYSSGMAGLATGTQGTTYDVADFDEFCVQAPASSACTSQ